MEKEKHVLIVGGGLSGLLLAYLLSKKNIGTTLLEGSSRLGGRIQTLKGVHDTPLELGATWCSEAHSHLHSLLKELGLEKFKQHTQGISLFQGDDGQAPQHFVVPETENPSFRIAGGTQAVNDALEKKLVQSTLLLQEKVTIIRDLGEAILVETEGGNTHSGSHVLLCMPPQLVKTSIQIHPPLPAETQRLLSQVHTWMAGSIKFVLEFASPFWRQKGFSGMLNSHVGPVTEMYDHSNCEETRFGFTGFLSPAAASISQNDRQTAVLNQLSALVGDQVFDALSYSDKVWTDEFVVGESAAELRPHQNNGHPILQQSFLGGKLRFAGTETSREFPGYMEGAVRAASYVAGTF